MDYQRQNQLPARKLLMQSIIVVFALTLVFAIFPHITQASDKETEKALQRHLEESRQIIGKAAEKAQSGIPVMEDITKLKEKAEDIRQLNLLLDEQFRMKEATMHQEGKAKQRQSLMAEAYRESLEEYLSLIDAIPPDGTGTQTRLEQLAAFLDRILHKKRLPIHGSLPYTHLNYPSREPNQDPPIKPAYKGGNKTVSPEDLNSTEEAPISEEIAALAQSLNWNPVSIYEYVKNAIETEWYWGCMKGAEETLRQKSGNDCDQAALLVSLFRASGFPSRYVRGTIAFFAGRDEPITKVKNLLGIDDPWKIAELFQKAGIPFSPVITGGSIANFQIEHIWVESEIPYANYRGAVIDGHGKTWLGLDTSIKVKDYQYGNPIDIFQQSAISGQLLAIRDEYLSAVRQQTPLEYVQTKIENTLPQSYPDKTYNDLLQSKTLPPEVMNILPASMQFDQKRVTHEYTEIPDELKHKVRFIATDTNNDELFNLQLETFKLSNRKVSLSYEPETVEDQQIIDSYGGLDTTPAYLVRLRPVLKVNGERMIVAKDGLPMGADYTLTIELISPNGTENIQSTHITGNLSVIGIVAQKTSNDELLAISEEDDAETIFHKETQNYIARWNQAEEELASLLHLNLTRPIPTVTTIGGVIDVTYVLDTPHGYEWKGVYCDANRRAIEVTPFRSPLTQGGEERQKTFMELSALQGSVLEHRIFEDDFQVPSVSTANLFQFAQSIAVPIITIDKTNVSALLPSLPFDDNILEDILNSVNQNFTLKIPQSEITYDDWTGVGYIKENIETGEAGYMLSGMTAGSNSRETPEQWALQYIVDKLKNPYAGEFNNNSLAAAKIVKIVVTDKQDGTVGKPLPQPLAVLVLDANNKPVKGATVTFRIIAGGGNFNGAQTHQSLTGKNGIAKAEQAPLTLGKYTADNPYYKKIDSKDEFVTQVGLNIVAASVKSTIGDISMSQPFKEYGKPDEPKEIIRVLGHGNTAMVNGPGGSLVAKVVDQYGNPISNLTIQIKTIKTESIHPDVPLPQQYRNVQFYKPADCNIQYPMYGECPTVEELKVKTEYLGAIVGTILGNTVNTKYIVQVVKTGIGTDMLPVLFELYTEGYRNKDDYIPPGVYIKYQPLVNENGQPIDAAKAGTQLKAPLVSELFMMYDDYILEGPNMCSYDPASTCWTLKPTGIVKVKPIKNGTVTYTPIQGGGSVTPTENLNNGKYRTKYTTGAMPSLNKVEALGKADITIPEVLLDPFAVNCSAPQPILMPSFSGTPSGNYKPLCKTAVTEYPEALLQCNGGCKLPESPISLKSGQQVIFQRKIDHTFSTVFGSEHKAEFIVYGVLPEVTGTKPKGIFLDVEGYTTHDTTIEYSINPPNKEEADRLQAIIDITTDPSVRQSLQAQIDALLAFYNAIIADIDIYEREPGSTDPNNDKWLYSLPGSAIRGEGTATIFRGTYFNSEKEHYAQVVLNKGSDAEVRGEKVPLGFWQFKIVAYDDRNTPMVGAVTDGAAKIKLQLIAKNSKAAFENLYWHLVDPQILDYPHPEMGTFMDGENPVASLPVVFNANGVAEAVYRAPESFVRWGTLEATKDKELPERYIQPTLDIASYIRTGKDPFAPIRLKRPPVVLVHGLWGNAFVWSDYISKFNEKKIYDIFPIDYSEEGQVSSITVHAKSLRSYINDQLRKMKTDYSFAISKVDIVAHSLGGLLTREYCKQFNSECKNKTRRFITIATPHFGSELADLLLVNRDDMEHFPDEFMCRETVDEFVRGGNIRLIKYLGLGFTKYNLDKPHPIGSKGKKNAIDDLATGRLPAFVQSSTTGSCWSDPNYLPLSGSLSAHTIVGLTTSGLEGIHFEIWGLWKLVLARCGFTRENVFGSESDLNDRIVKKSSQEGGVLSKYSTQVYDADHYTVRNEENTINKIGILLDEPSNSGLFTK